MKKVFLRNMHKIGTIPALYDRRIKKVLRSSCILGVVPTLYDRSNNLRNT